MKHRDDDTAAANADQPHLSGVTTWDVDAEVWRVPAGTWFFVTVSDDVSDEIAEITEGYAGGFGSVRVEATCGTATWRTSLFPSKTAGAYVLPLKKAVRESEGLTVGRIARFRLRLLDARVRAPAE